ncbi:polysaccharide biosynthesis/export family protein [Frateuria aurantia]|uniref:Periplasmic protein involved in polysaccharide export n=1 Tax=Frateuria aurantia (strain ATCC 33424 / DSM 6220 / KCTC 2777 / LMG 1558 / NBRC 3245 / NCIMB 13370) TaxID=767434 RepID=H8L0B3_FRAAD|nr:polysaccharide biosynthesis/export family protein [Frateuria aurantia]AFC87151.1 periplasmic protein involved in polysaccharide export [Frateuria aurantia DSM 6220]
MRRTTSWLALAFALSSSLALSGCAGIPTSGPSTKDINNVAKQTKAAGIQIVDVNEAVAQKLLNERQQDDFTRTLGTKPSFQQQFGIGDTLDISIWEAPPATLFGASSADGSAMSGTSHVTNLPVQMIDANGKVNVPFAGEITAAGKTAVQLEQLIANRLKGKANQPQVLVRLGRNSNSYVTVMGDIPNSARMELTPKGERILDAVASAGGIRQPINKMTVQVTRGDKVVSLPLETVIREPKENVPLKADDVVTLLYQPYSFTTLGAVGQTHEVNFEVQGITLAQALSRSGGLEDSRSDARGVFVFRFEKPDALPWPNQPVKARADGRVPVIYRFNLKDPTSLFVAQTFMMDDKDMLYISNAPIADMQKLMNIIFSFVYPITNIGVIAR